MVQFQLANLASALNEVYAHDNRNVVLTTQLVTNCTVIKAYRSSVECKCKLRGLLQLSFIVSVSALKILDLKVFFNLVAPTQIQMIPT